jgi:hypothetical protein
MELEITRFEEAEDVRRFDFGTFEVVELGGMTVGRASYEPGWQWSAHVGSPVGLELCDVEHVGLVVSGRAAVKMADGREFEMGPGDLFSIPGGHDSWVVGDEPYVSLHVLGAGTYAAGHEGEGAS